MSVIVNETVGIPLRLARILNEKISVDHGNSFPWNYLEIVSSQNLTLNNAIQISFPGTWVLLLKVKLLRYIFLSNVCELSNNKTSSKHVARD